MITANFWFDWSSLFLFSGILNAFIAGFLLTSRYRIILKPSSLLWLILLMLSIMILLGEQLLRNSVLLDHFPEFLFLGSPFLFLYLPLIFFYYESALIKTLKIWPHLVLPFFMLLIMLPTYSMGSIEKLEMFRSSEIHDPYWIIFLYLICFLFYYIRIFRANRELRRLVKNQSTDNRVENYEKTNNIIVGISLLALIFPVALTLQYLPIQDSTYSLTQKILFVIFSGSGHLALVGFLISKETIGETFALENIHNSKADVESAVGIEEKKQELLQMVEIKKLYLQSNLSLNTVAEEVGWSRTHLSYIINKGFEKNFYDFINSFRVEAIKQKIINGEHQKYSLEHIVLECGFTSYTSFYRIFKRIHNQTPSDFIKSLPFHNK